MSQHTEHGDACLGQGGQEMVAGDQWQVVRVRQRRGDSWISECVLACCWLVVKRKEVVSLPERKPHPSLTPRSSHHLHPPKSPATLSSCSWASGHPHIDPCNTLHLLSCLAHTHPQFCPAAPGSVATACCPGPRSWQPTHGLPGSGPPPACGCRGVGGERVVRWVGGWVGG